MVMEGLEEAHDAQSNAPRMVEKKAEEWNYRGACQASGQGVWMEAEDTVHMEWQKLEIDEAEKEIKEAVDRVERQKQEAVLEIEGMPGKKGCIRQRAGRKRNSPGREAELATAQDNHRSVWHPISRPKQRRTSSTPSE